MAPFHPNEHIFEITTMRLKGLGYKALKDIQPGTPIVAEDALFSILDGSPMGNNARRQAFQELGCPADPPTSRSRFDANSFGMGKGRNGREKHGIFLKASRINHSCIPNAYFAWNPDSGLSGQLTVYAITRIPKNAEILIDYCNLESYQDKQGRDQSRTQYGFECTCPACQPTYFGRASELRRVRMKTLEDQIHQNRNQAQPDRRRDLLSDLIELGNLVQQEGLFYPQLADVYHGQAVWWGQELQCVAKRTASAKYAEVCRERALEIARKKLDLDVTCNGHMSPEVKKTLKLIDEFRL